jgi:hypothetical protein
MNKVVTQRAESIFAWHAWSSKGSHLWLVKEYIWLVFMKELIEMPLCDGNTDDGVVQIGQRITHIPPTGLIICTPGEYVLNGDLEWAAAYPDSSAIRVTCSNVSIDFAGHSITCQRPFSKSCGVLVLSSDDEVLRNVHISGGAVRNFQLYGIACVGVDNVTLQSMTVQGLCNDDPSLTSIGLLAAMCKYVTVSKCSVTDSHVHSLAHSGLQVRACDTVTVCNTAVRRQRNVMGGSCGITVVATSQATVIDCEVSESSVGTRMPPAPLKSPGHTALGVFIFLSTNVCVSNTHAVHVHGSCDDSHGLSVFLCPGVVRIASCSAKDVTTGLLADGSPIAGGGAKATGVEVIGATDAYVTDVVVEGIRAFAPQDLQCAGVASSWCVDTVFERCVVKEVTCLDSGVAVGFAWAPDPRSFFIKPSMGTVFVSCVAVRCDVGFDMFMHQDAVLLGCTVQSVSASMSGGDPTETRVLSCNPCSECDPAMATTVRNAGYGTSGVAVRTFLQ